jgi:hypothetical protein
MQNMGMQATRAYIASAGTAVVMLGASLCIFVVVSAFVAFGSWPGAESHASVDQVLLRDVATPRPKTVAVRADAVAIARRAAAARGTAQRKSGAKVAPRGPGAQVPGRTTAPATSPAPSGATPAAAPKQAPVQQQADNVASSVDTTTRNVVTQVKQQAQTVQTQVNEVVTQVIGSPPPPVITNPVDGVKNAAGSLLGG